MIYSQTAARLYLGNDPLAPMTPTATEIKGPTLASVFYSGGNLGRAPGEVNNPLFQFTAMTGPIPQGVYQIGPLHADPKLGPCLALTPHPANVMKGRSGFFIHYINVSKDRNGWVDTSVSPARIILAGQNSSEGCIVCRIAGMLDTIEAHRAAGDDMLTVVP